MRLSLNKVYSGYYRKTAGDITVDVSNPKIAIGTGPNEWQLVITKDGLDDELVNEWFDTKRAAYAFATNWIIENL